MDRDFVFMHIDYSASDLCVETSFSIVEWCHPVQALPCHYHSAKSTVIPNSRS